LPLLAPRERRRAPAARRVVAFGPLLALSGLLAGGGGCGSTRYASPSAAQAAGDGLPFMTYPIFKNRNVAVRVIDNRMDRPQSAVLVDEVRGLVEGSLSRAQSGKGSEPPAVFEVRIVRYGADSHLSKWRACVGFGATVEIAPTVRHDVSAERCAITANVWGTESADQVLREAYRQASHDLLSQVDVLRAPAPMAPATPAVAPAAVEPRPAGAAPASVPTGPAESAPAAP
jgi:hypothetical protein